MFCKTFNLFPGYGRCASQSHVLQRCHCLYHSHVAALLFIIFRSLSTDNSRVITKFPQQNIELGLQFCTGTVSEQQFSELLSSSLVECLIYQMLSDFTIAYSQEPTTAPVFRGAPNIRSTWPTSQSLKSHI